jgi:hypothetical protein
VSTSWGIRVIIGHLWYAIQLGPDWKRPGLDICWLEAVTIELVLMFLVQKGVRDIHVLIRSDNKGAIGTLTKGRSPNIGINLCAQRSFAIAAGHLITPNIVYVPTAENLADGPSHGNFPERFASGRMERLFELPSELKGVFHEDAP